MDFNIDHDILLLETQVASTQVFNLGCMTLLKGDICPNFDLFSLIVVYCIDA